MYLLEPGRLAMVERSSCAVAARGGGQVSVQSVASSQSSAKVTIFSGDAIADPSGTLSLSTGSGTDGSFRICCDVARGRAPRCWWCVVVCWHRPLRWLGGHVSAVAGSSNRGGEMEILAGSGMSKNGGTIVMSAGPSEADAGKVSLASLDATIESRGALINTGLGRTGSGVLVLGTSSVAAGALKLVCTLPVDQLRLEWAGGFLAGWTGARLCPGRPCGCEQW